MKPIMRKIIRKHRKDEVLNYGNVHRKVRSVINRKKSERAFNSFPWDSYYRGTKISIYLDPLINVFLDWTIHPRLEDTVSNDTHIAPKPFHIKSTYHYLAAWSVLRTEDLREDVKRIENILGAIPVMEVNNEFCDRYDYYPDWMVDDSLPEENIIIKKGDEHFINEEPIPYQNEDKGYISDWSVICK